MAKILLIYASMWVALLSLVQQDKNEAWLCIFAAMILFGLATLQDILKALRDE